MGVRELRTGLSWADWHRPNATAWFNRQMHKLEDFDVTLTFCFTPPSVGRRPHTCAEPAATPIVWPTPYQGTKEVGSSKFDG